VRVLVLPFRHADARAARAVTEAFALELAKSQAFEVLSPDDPSCQALGGLKLWDNGGLDLRAMTTLRRRCKVEGLVLGHITHYRAYAPPVLGLRVQVVSARSGAVLWGAEGHFDARQESVRALARHFHDRVLDASGRSYGWSVVLDSPRHYAQFVSQQLVATLRADRTHVAARPLR
jgi:hypothetical protein